MQPPKEESSKQRFGLWDYFQLFQVMARYGKHPEMLDSYLATLKDKGLSNEKTAALRSVIIARLQVTRDTGTSYRLDSYL